MIGGDEGRDATAVITEVLPVPDPGEGSAQSSILGFRVPPLGTRDARRRASRSAVVVMAVASAVLSYVWGRRQFAGFDFSGAMNAAWQLVHGRVPYEDFLTGLPPSYLLGLRLAYWVQPNFQSLILLQALAVLVSSLLMARLAAARFGEISSAPFIGIALIAGINLPISFPWYNQSAATAAVLTFAAAAVVFHNPRSRWVYVLPAFLVLTAFSKPNLGVPAAMLGLAFAAFGLLRERRRVALAGVITGSLVLTVGLLLATSVRLDAMYYNYRDAAERVRTGGAYGEVFRESGSGLTYPLAYAYAAIALVGIVLVLVAAIVDHARGPAAHGPSRVWRIDAWWFELAMGVAFAAVFAYGLQLDNDLKTNEVLPALFCLWWPARAVPGTSHERRFLGPISLLAVVVGTALWWPRSSISAATVVVLAGIAIAASALEARARPEPYARGWIARAGTILLCLSLVLFVVLLVPVSADRQRVRAAGLGVFYEDAPLRGFGASSSLHGVVAGPHLQEVKEALDVVGRTSCLDDVHDRIVVGPRIEFAYAEEDWLPPEGLPLWWESYRDGVTGQRYSPEAALEAEPAQLAVFLPGDYTFMSRAVLEQIRAGNEQRTWNGLELWAAPAIASCLDAELPPES